MKAFTFLGLVMLLISSVTYAEEKINLTSDTMEYDQQQERHLAEGNVFLTRGPMQLRANRLSFDNKSKRLKGSGDVAFTENGNTLFASEIEYDLLTEQGVLLDGRLFLKSTNYTLTGKRIERLGLGQMNLHDAFFTACDCPEDPAENPDWHIKAASIRLTIGTYLTVKNLFFYVNKTPILYLPYFIYPAVTTRQTGLLVPRIGGSSTQGLRYNQDFFWAFSQNQDATFSLDYRRKKGVGTGIEYRYVLSTESRGTLTAERFHDIEKDLNRIAVAYRHQQRFSDRIKFNLNARYVNAENYYKELSDFTAERALQKLESTAALTYRGEESFGYISAHYTQDLTGTNGSTTLQRLPEAGWSLIGHKIGITYFDLHTTYIRFLRKTDFDWERIQLSPRLSLPIRVSSHIMATPWVAYHGIEYSRTLLLDRSYLRNITATGIDLHSEIDGTIWKTPIRFSKKLTYEEINTDDNQDFPQADDIDKIHSRRSITLSLHPRTSFTSMRLTQTYSLGERLSASPLDRLSDLRTEWSITPSPFFTLNTDVFYRWQNQNVTAVNTDLRFSMRDRVKVSVGQRYTQGGTLLAGGGPPQKGDLFNPLYLGDTQTVPPVSFITGRLKAKLSDRIQIAAEALYNADADQFIEMHYGLLYERQCWLITLAYQELLGGTGTANQNEFFATVSLKGLGENLPRKFATLFNF
jgi:LPS-assembly protein